MILEAMNTVQIKQKIHDYIEHADERFLRLVNSMVESEEAGDKLFSTSDDEMIKRAKESLKSVENGNTRNIHALKKDLDTWRKNRTTQLR
jgi:polyhydroxyalkanoate synthesis regulator phasin